MWEVLVTESEWNDYIEEEFKPKKSGHGYYIDPYEYELEESVDDILDELAMKRGEW